MVCDGTEYTLEEINMTLNPAYTATPVLPGRYRVDMDMAKDGFVDIATKVGSDGIPSSVVDTVVRRARSVDQKQ
jgi:hypothetical protein